MIVNIRGTNGAGKSTIVRSVMGQYRGRMPVSKRGRRKPIGYTLNRGDEWPELFVPGHYEIANGGLDTLHDLDWGYELIEEMARREFDVLYEGMNMQESVHRVNRLGKVFGVETVCVVCLSPPLDECVRGVRARGHSIQEKTIERLHRKVEREYWLLREAGSVQVALCHSRSTALGTVQSLLRLPATLRLSHEGSPAGHEQSSLGGPEICAVSSAR